MRAAAFFGFVLAFFLGGCASNYHSIQPLKTKFDGPTQTLDSGRVVVSWKYDVLKNSRNRKYARKERKHHISLLAIRVENRGADTLFLPEDWLVLSKTDTLRPLRMDDVADLLQQTTAEDTETGDVDVMADGWWIEFLRQAINSAKQGVANARFEKELDEFYLLPSEVSPGKKVVGLLALPVKKGAPLVFSLRPRPVDKPVP